MAFDPITFSKVSKISGKIDSIKPFTSKRMIDQVISAGQNSSLDPNPSIPFPHFVLGQNTNSSLGSSIIRHPKKPYTNIPSGGSMPLSFSATPNIPSLGKGYFALEASVSRSINQYSNFDIYKYDKETDSLVCTAKYSYTSPSNTYDAASGWIVDESQSYVYGVIKDRIYRAPYVSTGSSVTPNYTPLSGGHMGTSNGISDIYSYNFYKGKFYIRMKIGQVTYFRSYASLDSFLTDTTGNNHLTSVANPSAFNLECVYINDQGKGISYYGDIVDFENMTGTVFNNSYGFPFNWSMVREFMGNYYAFGVIDSTGRYFIVPYKLNIETFQLEPKDKIVIEHDHIGIGNQAGLLNIEQQGDDKLFVTIGQSYYATNTNGLWREDITDLAKGVLL
jgi:hypothetical protein